MKIEDKKRPGVMLIRVMLMQLKQQVAVDAIVTGITPQDWMHAALLDLSTAAIAEDWPRSRLKTEIGEAYDIMMTTLGGEEGVKELLRKVEKP